MTRSEMLALLAAAPFSIGGSGAPPYEMLVLGDSVTWGQGLNDEQKMHRLLVPRIQALTNRTVNPYHYAHSGAAIGIDEFEVLDRASPPPRTWFKEIPTPEATIFQQCHRVARERPNQDFDLVLVCGGINDVDVTYIFSAIGNAGTIEELAREHCFRHMGALLDRIGAQFVVPSSRPTLVLVLGYYSILGASSVVPNLQALLRAFGARIPKFITRLRKGGIPISLFQGLLDNSRAFASASTSALRAAVDAANQRFETNRFLFIDPKIGEANAAFTERPMIFGLNGDAFPEDPMATARDIYCHDIPRRGIAEYICQRASTGHPNQCGAARYADVIFDVIASAAAPAPDSSRK